jgi:hypothetical protein
MRRFLSLLVAIVVFVGMQWAVGALNAYASQTFQVFPYGYLAMLVRIFGYQLIAILLLKDSLLMNSRKLPRTFTGLVTLFLVNALVMWVLYNHGIWLNRVYIPFAYIDGIVWMVGLLMAEYVLNS